MYEHWNLPSDCKIKFWWVQDYKTSNPTHPKLPKENEHSDIYLMTVG